MKKFEENFNSLKDFRSHKQNSKSCQALYECEECEKSFKVKQQLEEHVKVHKKYPCDECDKVFNYEVTLEKHVGAAHEDYEIYRVRQRGCSLTHSARTLPAVRRN